MSSSPVILNNINVDRGRVQKRIESPSVASNGQSSTHFYSQKTFYDLKISKYVETVVNAFSLSRPSKIQALSYQTIANGTSCVLADQTGSGRYYRYNGIIIEYGHCIAHDDASGSSVTFF